LIPASFPEGNRYQLVQNFSSSYGGGGYSQQSRIQAAQQRVSQAGTIQRLASFEKPQAIQSVAQKQTQLAQERAASARGMASLQNPDVFLSVAARMKTVQTEAQLKRYQSDLERQAQQIGKLDENLKAQQADLEAQYNSLSSSASQGSLDESALNAYSQKVQSFNAQIQNRNAMAQGLNEQSKLVESQANKMVLETNKLIASSNAVQEQSFAKQAKEFNAVWQPTIKTQEQLMQEKTLEIEGKTIQQQFQQGAEIAKRTQQDINLGVWGKPGMPLSVAPKAIGLAVGATDVLGQWGTRGTLFVGKDVLGYKPTVYFAKPIGEFAGMWTSLTPFEAPITMAGKELWETGKAVSTKIGLKLPETSFSEFLGLKSKTVITGIETKASAAEIKVFSEGETTATAPFVITGKTVTRGEKEFFGNIFRGLGEKTPKFLSRPFEKTNYFKTEAFGFGAESHFKEPFVLETEEKVIGRTTGTATIKTVEKTPKLLFQPEKNPFLIVPKKGEPFWVSSDFYANQEALQKTLRPTAQKSTATSESLSSRISQRGLVETQFTKTLSPIKPTFVQKIGQKYGDFFEMNLVKTVGKKYGELFLGEKTPKYVLLPGEKGFTVTATQPEFVSILEKKAGTRTVFRENVFGLKKPAEEFGFSIEKFSPKGSLVGKQRSVLITTEKGVPSTIEFKADYELFRIEPKKVILEKGKLPSREQMKSLKELAINLEKEKTFLASPQGLLQVQKEREAINFLGLPTQKFKPTVSKRLGGITQTIQRQASEATQKSVSTWTGRMTGKEFFSFSPQIQRQRQLQEQRELQQLISEGEYYQSQQPMIGTNFRPVSFGRTSTINLSKNIVGISGKVAVIGFSKIGEKTKESEKTLVGEKAILKGFTISKMGESSLTKSVLKESTITGLRSGLLEKSMLRTGQKQLQKMKEMEKTKTVSIQRQIITPIIVPKIKVPTIPIVIPKEESQIFPIQKRFGKLFAGFNVFVKRRGKFSLVGKELPKGRAMQLGARITALTAARTFKIEPTGEPTRLRDISFRLSSAMFRPGIKKGLPDFGRFVERTKFAINAPIEKQEIPGRAAQLRRMGFFKKVGKKGSLNYG
jgi:hypothetical protein